MPEPLLATQDLTRVFRGHRRRPGRAAPRVVAVEGVDLAVARGGALGLVGESGSGKSTVARLMVGLLAPTRGEVRFEGTPLTDLDRAGRRRFHRRVQMVFQNPAGSLNPRRTVRRLLEQPLAALLGLDRAARRARVDELLDRVSLDPGLLERYPHELSGGEAQRAAIARALAPEPRLLVLDEPVSSLDVSVQAQILALLRDLRARLGLAYVFIGHDLAVVEKLCDTVAVMREGRIVESGPRAEVFARPRHDYTRLLLSSVPVPGRRVLTAGAGAPGGPAAP